MQLEQTMSEQQRLKTLLEERDVEQERLMVEHQRTIVEHQRVTTEHRTDHAQAERDLADAASRTDEVVKALENRRVELQSVERNARNLESLAAAGRLALDIGRELHTLVAAVDTRAKFLLDQCSLDAADREEIEALRGDAIRAASLARQIVQVSAHADERSSSSIMTAQIKRFTIAGRNE
jgi:hypothetical protein